MMRWSQVMRAAVQKAKGRAVYAPPGVRIGKWVPMRKKRRMAKRR